jgi:uncharacterized membrane protein YphA (DoxX/SURF4 family)
MIKRLKTILLFCSLMFITLQVTAQETAGADAMRSEGKINVVIVIASLVLVFMGIYMFSIDKKVSKLEKNNKQ